ncbi:MAG: hypothetical protein JXQ75_15175 [Phycisphaerae bacterium]|nr:hypothetical protein [Phycisphaerae bacterium]
MGRRKQLLMGGREAVGASKLVKRVVVGLFLCWLMAGLVGCALAPFDPGLESSFTPSAPVAPGEAAESAPATPDTKPTSAEDESYERHPSKWRKKLRAKYA